MRGGHFYRHHILLPSNIQSYLILHVDYIYTITCLLYVPFEVSRLFNAATSSKESNIYCSM